MGVNRDCRYIAILGPEGYPCQMIVRYTGNLPNLQ